MGDASAGPSRLPRGWTSHTSPVDGRTYYHNSATGISTYRPPHLPKPKREKPISRTPIPNTDGWFKILTNKDNVFYCHPESKRSEWLPPKEIVVALQEMEESEVKERERLKREAEDREREERRRLKQEKRERKRKLEEGVPITEFDALEGESKRVRVESEDEDDEEDDEIDASSASDEEPTELHSQQAEEPDVNASEQVDDDEDAEWQRQIASEMAAEAEDSEAPPSQENPQPPPSPPAPTSLEDQKSTFFSHLSSLSINPMAPYDLEQPKFSSHPSYLALPEREREDAFNEWCKIRLRERRAARAATSAPSASAEQRYLNLLKEEVRSTRTKYSDFKHAFSRDSRFSNFKSDAEREKHFRKHLVELGEQKRKAAERAEEDFLQLLSDKVPGNYRGKVSAAKAQGKDAVMEVWMEAKKGLVEDKRYDAVGSSTRRFELFCSWAKGERRAPSLSPPTLKPREDEASRKAREKDQARQQALKKREEEVRREREKINRLNRSAFSAATREESILSFRQLLLDAVHSPHTDYPSSVAQLSSDPRFSAPYLSEDDKQRLFSEHREQLLAKQSDRLGAVFARHAKTLDSHPEDVIALTLADPDLTLPPLNTFAQDPVKLQAAYARWDEERQKKAESEFKEMLKESAFVEFWGRLKKSAAATTEDVGDKGEGKEEGEDEGEGGSLVDMARKVDLKEIQSVLRNDARFRAFKHDPERRERWIREHLERLAAPNNSVHR